MVRRNAKKHNIKFLATNFALSDHHDSQHNAGGIEQNASPVLIRV